MWMLYDCKHVYLDDDLGLVIFSCFFLGWTYHIFSPIFTIPLCPLQFMQQATNFPSITLLPYLCHMLEPGSPTQLTETARFAIDRLILHYIVFKNINIFDSRQQCLWMYQNIWLWRVLIRYREVIDQTGTTTELYFLATILTRVIF